MLPSLLVKLLTPGFVRNRRFFPSRVFAFLRSLFGSKPPKVRQPWTVKDFSSPNFERIDPDELVEEETVPRYNPEMYYPVRIGEVFSSRYQVVGKLGFGVTSTVWLARDLKESCYVALKIYVQSSIFGDDELPELAAYRRLEQGPEDHPGRHAIRSLLDSFIITGPHGEHRCLVHPPLWGSLRTWSEIMPRLIPPMLATVLKQLFLALDYAKECKVIHTDISRQNIMFKIEDNAVLERFEQEELEHPSPRKEVNGRFIYLSRPIGLPERVSGLGLPVLCDFGSAVWGGEKRDKDAQPNIYRSPEVILQVPWSYEIDIWNVGCLIWDLFEGEGLFSGIDEEHKAYRLRTHLSEMISLLGLPPTDFIARGGSRSSKFFSPDGKFIAGIEIPPSMSWADLETTLRMWEGEGERRDLFLRLMTKMIQWNPQDRHTAKQLLEDAWITGVLADQPKMLLCDDED